MRNSYRTLVMVIGAACVLAIAEPAAAQTSRTTSRTRSPSTARVSTRVQQAQPRTQARPAAQPSSTRTQVRSVGTTVVRPRVTSPVSRRVSTTINVNRAARATADASEVRSGRQPTRRSAISRTLITRPSINVADGEGRVRDRNVRDARRPLDRNDRDGSVRDRRGGDDGVSRGGATRYEVRRPPRDTYRRGYRDGYRHGYDSGYTWGYHNGYHRGYHVGYAHGHHYGHRHYYGPHLVFGYHFGGFGFYRGHWHFAIVIGSPYVHHHHHHYGYSWWDGRGARLVSWRRAVETYPASYAFDNNSCVALWLRTTEGADYEIKVDPRYYNAYDPGDLYAELWAELEQEGQLRIEDIYGAVHVFPAGMIRQIEASACR